MLNFRSALASLLITFSLTSFAGPQDVRSSGDKFIKVNILSNSNRSFELCKKSNSYCSPIGYRSYSLKELNKLKTKLDLQLAGSSVASVLGLACATVGVIAGGSAIASAGLADLAGTALGVTFIGGSVGGVVLGALSDYNPVSIYNRRAMLNDEIINDQDIKVDGGDKKIETLAKRLGTALQSLR